MQSLRERIARLDEAAYLQSVVGAQNGIKNKGNNDRVARIACEIADCKRELAEQILGMEEKACEIERLIKGLDVGEQAIIRARYIDGMPWRQVARATNYSIDSCFRIHKQAIEKLTVNNI